MTIPPLDILLLFGALQGFILAALLWFNPKGNRLANRLLAALVGLLGLASFAVSIPVINWQARLFLDLAPLIMAMPVGPLIYFYVRSVLDPDFKLGQQQRRHFWPVLIDWGGKITGWGFLVGAWLGLVDPKDNLHVGYFMDEYNTYSDIPRWISVTVYLLVTRRWVNRFQQTGTLTEQQQLNKGWLRQFITLFLGLQVVWFIHLVPYIIPATRDALLDAFGWYPLYIPIAMLIYWLGLRGYIHARSQPIPPASRKSNALALPKEQADQTVGRLQRAMTEDKLYLDPELTVDKVGRHVQLPPKMVSAVLNQHLGKSFNRFVNEYRINEVKRRIGDSSQAHLTLTGIAFDCGFNSQATFQRTFKQLTGHTPKEHLTQ